jgi:hypothetical protein
MKNKIKTFRWAILFFLSPFYLQAQDLSAKAFFNSDAVPAVFLGIDFTQAKLINDDLSNATVIQSQQFNGINDLVVHENKKYDVQDAYHRTNWTTDVKEVESRNSKSSPDQLKSSNDADLTRLNQSDIEKLVKNFDFSDHKGYGVLLVMEGMDKTQKMATIWFTLVDMGAKKVLVTDRVEGKLGSGFGFRNYWASAIKNAISKAKSKHYDQWKSSAK